MNKKKIVIILIIVLIVIAGLSFIGVNLKREEKEITQKKYTIQELEEYGEYLKTLDLKPNTIVAKINGEEILFHEITWILNQQDYNEENNISSEITGKNPFIKVLQNYIYIKLAKDFPDYSQYNMNIETSVERIEKEWNENDEEWREKYLNVLGIDVDEVWLNDEDFLKYLKQIAANIELRGKGIKLFFELMTEKPELAKSNEFDKKVKEYKKLRTELEEQKSQFLTSQEYIDNYSKYVKLTLEIKDDFMKNLIINSKIELCADKNELSARVPEIESTNSD